MSTDDAGQVPVEERLRRRPRVAIALAALAMGALAALLLDPEAGVIVAFAVLMFLIVPYVVEEL